MRQRHRLVPAGGLLLTGQDEQVLRVAVHVQGNAAQPGQAGQALGVQLAVLKALDQAQLAFHQGLASTGQVHEHGVELGALDRIAGRRTPGFPARLVEGAPRLVGPVDGVHLERLGRVAGGRMDSSPAARCRSRPAGVMRV